MGAQITLRHLRCFSAVAQTGSFTLAAQKLFLTQSSLTATIKQLEKLAGLKLFDRTTRRVELTKDAVWFKVVSDRVLREFDTAIMDLQAVSQSRLGHIKIAAAPSMITYILTPTLITFRQKYPDIAISVYDENSDMIEHSVLSGEKDFGLASKRNNFSGLDYSPIITDPLGVIFPCDHPLADHKGKINWSDLKAYNYVGLTNDTGIAALIESYQAQDTIGNKDSFDHASSTTSLYSLLKLGGKISVLPSLAAHMDPLSEFHFRELDSPKAELDICLITRHQRSLSPSTQRFLEVLMETIKTTKNLFSARLYQG